MRRRHLGVTLGTVLALAGCSVSGGAAVPPGGPAGTAPTSSAGAVATVTVPDSAAVAAVQKLYERRIAGLEHGDVAAWLQGLRGATLTQQQRAVYDRMRALQVADLAVAEVTQPRGEGTAAAMEGQQLQVGFSYRLTGFDTAPRRFVLDLTVEGAPGTAAGMVVTASRPADRPQPWDLPDLQVRRSGAMLVALSGTAAEADDLAAEAGAAAHRVGAVLGSRRPAVVVAPATDELAAQLLGRAASGLAHVAAVTDGPLADGRAGADRVVVVPTAWASLSSTGREVVLAHELTHVTTRAEGVQATPLWVSEGLAEYVAYQVVRLPEQTIVASALERVRRAGVPTGWPDDALFDPGTGDLSVAYGLALLACREIADRHGRTALIRFSRAAARGSVEDAFRLIGTDGAAERRAWQARIRALLGQGDQR